ncbi:LytR C-terminal domain-containing protein [Blastococcus sp. TML/M2B]|uniref:LytR C-terminal domain-containing protein n=1 Tax=unclassified Blastococcus TaxID=2619396 RepID=UPI00190947A7|nr:MULTISPECIES: LytR C-terminal domain-containing protein [unclassified Blastococcus]MBN1091456.1 LytR C-terminal domain-containing protein [Blastococcus sp. TML/M2B]MBN1094988.1 LytR C-terminal domain-containing protein [Blastococcus sp. TML/C7B]
MANRPGDAPGQMSRSRLPLPPVPASGRPAAAPAPAAPVSAAPVSAAPRAAGPVTAGPLAESLRAAEAAAARRKSIWTADAEPLASSTGPTGLRTGEPAPRLPRQTAGASDSRYGDWTKPSRSGDQPADQPPAPAVAAAPATTAIPERSVTRRDADARDEDLSDIGNFSEEIPAPRAERSPARPVGGRAALRAERQAAEAARLKAAKDSGVALLDEEPRRAPRRVATGLVAMAVVALGVLGVYQFTSPQTSEAGASTATTPAPVAPIAPLAPLPELEIDAAPVEPTVTTPVRVPLVTLNATTVTGLAAKISGVVEAGGWESAGVGAYEGDDVSASTVFYTEGDDTQYQAALQLVEQFPQLAGPAPRFFELPAEVTTPSLVIVAAGDWKP